LEITNQGKDYFIDQLQEENQSKVEQLITFSRKGGELGTKLLQLAPSVTSTGKQGGGVNGQGTVGGHGDGEH